jgi:hypothetical protein
VGVYGQFISSSQFSSISRINGVPQQSSNQFQVNRPAIQPAHVSPPRPNPNQPNQPIYGGGIAGKDAKIVYENREQRPDGSYSFG